MDILERVREVRPDSPLDETRIGRSRALLAQEIARGQGRTHRTTAAWAVGGGLGGLVVTAAAATAVAIAVNASPSGIPDPGLTEAIPAPSVSVEPPRPTPTPRTTPAPPATPTPLTAAGVLEGAAALASSSAGSELASGRYLRVENTLEQLVFYGADAESSPYNATRATATAAWVSTGRYVTYIPADRSREWVRVFEPERKIVALYGTDADSLSVDWVSQMLGEQIVDRYQGGLDFLGDVPVYASDAYFAQMPRDPQQLLDWIRSRMIERNVEDVDGGVVDVLVQDLELNAAPADLRATMFRALSLVPGVEVASIEGAVTTLRFRFAHYGAGLGTVSIDTGTGLVTTHSTTYGSGSAIVPDSVPDDRVTTTLTVVDAAP